jgi:hypothetical protein
MLKPKFLVVARNEYRIHVNKLGRLRPYFPFLVIGLLGVYVAFIAPAVVSLFIDDFMAFILSQIALVIIPLIMFMLFFYLMILPVTYTLQGMQAGQVEIFLAAPINPSDILLGEFLGEAPFYAIAITVFTGLFTAALSPVGLDIFQMGLIVIIFMVTLLSALWIGTVIAALVRTKFAESARGRDIGKALSLVLALPIVAVMYAIMGGGLLEVLANPGTSGIVKNFLSMLPSTWGADIIVAFASNPGNIGAVGFETFTKLGGLLLFFVGVMWLGRKGASRIYRIEPTSFTASRAKPDGFFYRSIKSFGGGKSFGLLLTSVFKDYSRRLENLSRIAYILAIFVMVNVFFVRGFSDPEGVLIMAQFLFPFLAVFMVGQVAVHGKESFFIFKKTPYGIGRFVKAKLVQGWLVSVPVATLITVLSLTLTPQAYFFSFLVYTVLIIFLVSANVLLALGLALFNPQFKDSARAQMGSLMLNANIAMFSSIAVFIGSMAILDWGILNTLLLQNLTIWSLGLLFLYLGKRKLDRIE